MDESDDTLRGTPPSCREKARGPAGATGRLMAGEDDGEPIEKDLLVLDVEDEQEEDQWLLTLSTAADSMTEGFENWRLSAHEDALMVPNGRKKSLARKLDELTKNGSPIHSENTSPMGTGGGGVGAPGSPLNAYLQQQRISSSTPKASPAGGNFDGRTFTRGQRERFLRQSNSPMRQALNLTFEKAATPPLATSNGLNATFTADPDDGINNKVEPPTNGFNATFDKAEDRLNQTFELLPSQGRNSTFTRRKSSSNRNNGDMMILPSAETVAQIDRRLSRGSSHDPMEEDVLSTTSDSSLSHQLNGVGDVQNIARIQEESLKMPENNHNAQMVNVISPQTSDHSPNTDYPSEGSLASDLGGPPNQASYGQYSSQDSLPDSPYSSQSLDSQANPGPDRIGRSMPNLNKRGLPPANHQQQQRRAPSANPASHISRNTNNSYGLSRQHNSDPRLLQRAAAGNNLQPRNLPHHGYRGGRSTASAEPATAQQPPSRGATAPPQGRTSGLRPPSASGSRIARPMGSGIPRPGSRLPMPASSSSASGRSRLIPPGSGVGARSTSIGRQGRVGAQNGADWRDECY